jgi:hypothetical protein
MANYYTTRFNPVTWPPEGDHAPPGVEERESDLAEGGRLCCNQCQIVEARAATTGERWVYRVTYALHCPAHGGTELEMERRLDWISPNEYLLP